MVVASDHQLPSPAVKACIMQAPMQEDELKYGGCVACGMSFVYRGPAP
jgi:hypothetical protein